MAARSKCLDCGDNNSLAEYADGTFCFACKIIHKNKSMLKKEIEKKKMLPLDIDLPGTIPEEYMNYLIKYSLVNLATTKGSVFWSTQYNRLCFPYFNKDGVVIGCWMRSLNLQPKWLYYGVDKSNFTWIYRKDTEKVSKKVVLVEDVLSALKCSKFCDTICLGGTSLSEINKRNINIYNEVVIFTDGDNAGKYAKKIIRNELKLNHQLTILRNKKDPKEYQYKQLLEMLK